MTRALEPDSEDIRVDPQIGGHGSQRHSYWNMLTSPQSYRCLVRTLAGKAGVMSPARKVFVIGLHKSGTTSIHHLFKNLGLHSEHSVVWSDPRNKLHRYMFDAFSDGPVHMFARLDRDFPSARFILNVRDLDQWLDSRRHHIDYEMRENPAFVPNEYWNDSDEALEHAIVARERQHSRVLKYFKLRPDDLLIINFIRDPDAVSKIADFLDIDRTPVKPHILPIAQKRTAERLVFHDQIVRVMDKMGIDPEERGFDLYCPSRNTDPELGQYVPDTSLLS